LELALDIAAWLCILSGSFFSVVGGIGLLRLPDVFTRLHASSITDSLGAGLIFLGLILTSGLTLVSVKLAMIMAMLLLTSPTTAHAIAKAARMSGLRARTREGTSS
jgi:multicomponent Na+:H+ antiporter subunit G